MVNAPVYATKLTMGLIDSKNNMLRSEKRKVVKHGQSINLGCFRVEFIKMNHSIEDAAALAVFTPAGIILNTGDFKIDYTPVFGDVTDLQRLAELGKKGVLALLCDSTNAIRPGFTMSEKTVGKTFDAIFAEHQQNRIIVATFASNVDRVQQVINSACKYGRKVVVEGRSMVNVIGTAQELGYINIPDGTLIDIEQLKNYKEEDTVLITTGSQGESMAALSRMASSMHRKVSITPRDVVGDVTDLQRLAELGKKGVLALLCDSTNAIRPGFTMSERTVGKTFDAIFAEHQQNRIIVATFASNVDRVQQVINSACKYGRKVVVEGRSMVNVIGTAQELGYINIPDGTLVDIEQLKNYKEEDTVLITTGSQGESMAALSRMASSMHRKVSITPRDVVVLSSTPIPGNEKAVSRVINELSMKGAKVISQDTHVSGHACQEEIKLVYSLVRPKFAIPIHGEYRHRMAQKELAISLGIPKENVVMLHTGDVLEIGESGADVIDHVQSGGVLVDGLGVGDVGNIVLRDRQNLAQNGIIIVVLTLEKHSNMLLSGPDIVSRGFVYVRESEDLMEEAQAIVDQAVADCLERHVSDWGKIKNIIRDSLSDFLWKRIKRNPMILPIIMEV